MARVKRDFANILADEMLSRYEHRITKKSDGGLMGHTFNEIYELKTLTPRNDSSLFADVKYLYDEIVRKREKRAHSTMIP